MSRPARATRPHATRPLSSPLRTGPSPALLGAALLAFGLTACSTLRPADTGVPAGGLAAAGIPALTPTPEPPLASTAAVQARVATPTHPTSAGQRPFADVLHGAQRHEGVLPIWTADDKVWIELSPQAFGKPFFLSPKLATGIGEAGIFGGLMQSRWATVGRPQWVEFRHVHKQVQLVAVNAAYTAALGSPQARAVQAAFSPSLLGSVPVASAPDSKTGAVLIEANTLLLGDFLGIAQRLQQTYRQNYGLDGRNSTVLAARTDADSLVFEVQQHYATASIATHVGAPPPPGTPTPSVPRSLPDPRSLFVTIHYSLSALPDKPMRPRRADPRVGYFSSTVADFSDELARTPKRHYINRWRLEKKDPSAPLSPPVTPIVFWLDPSIPEAYVGAITEGVLAWNKAFEAIGLANAIEVRRPPKDQPFDTQATGHNAIRWMTNSSPLFGAIGPTHVDPRTGEILDADIALESLSSRAIRTVRSQYFDGADGASGQAFSAHPSAVPTDGDPPLLPDSCVHAQAAQEQLALALDVLQARHPLDPDSPQVKAFVLAYLKDTTMHEVGHALGLRHNFRGSRWHTAQELQDLALTSAEGNSASVMDYAPINLPPPGQQGGAPFQTTLGPYDYWAIAYGYRPLPDDPAAADKALRAIADRSAEPGQQDTLAFGTDEDNAVGLDPQAMMFDLGRDPIAFAKTRLAIVQDLFQRLATRPLSSIDDPSLLRRSVSYGLRDLARTSQILLRQVGGLVTRRDLPSSGRDQLDPLPVTTQRAALTLLSTAFLSPRAVPLPPALLRHLAPDYFERQDALRHGGKAPTDFSWEAQQLALQRQVLAYLMDEDLAERLLDNIDKTRDREPHPLTVQELHRALFDAVWLAGPPDKDADSARRNLQRDYVNRLALSVVKADTLRADVRAIVRQQARTLLRRLKAGGLGGSGSAAAAHRQDCIDTLSKALDARVTQVTP